MARTVIDLDEEKLALAAEIFGTTRKVATVNAALEDVLKRRKRDSFATWLKEGGLPDLTGPVDAQATEHQGAPHRAAPHRAAPHRAAPHRAAPHRGAAHRAA